MKTDQQQPPPPWKHTPDVGPANGFWRQGDGEAWLLEVWLPFWRTQSADERASFMQEHPAPNMAWHAYLTHHWTGAAK